MHSILKDVEALLTRRNKEVDIKAVNKNNESVAEIVDNRTDFTQEEQYKVVRIMLKHA